ncbi:hypothetical protein [Tunturiibacter gelidoferens]|uniref:Glycosyltransferase RgtA/B/C/D-like domain-containing protein n=1 Tax=Tunturiibacter lichenicola TaxID=2051959 RepID=A0A7Y9NJS1_9BACT|nr:hypothetical protein [Edaphobacter lichenicola]NYF50656.1 hypothetical protein [Edaphobacter lichenicola]
MTPASLLHFLEALVWCALLFLSIVGYGALFLRLFAIRRPSVTLAATSGFGVVIFLGGCLNLLHAITAPVLISFTILGLLAAILLRITINETDTSSPAPLLQKPSAASKAVPILLLVTALVFIVRIAATVHTQSYQASDDYNFYLAAPAKMLRLHHYAADPFSERRIMSSIGGNDFLQTLVLAVLPLADVQMADRALGLLLLALLSFSLAAEFRLTPPQRAVFALLVFTTPQLTFNLTFVLLPSAFFFALVYLAAHRKLLAANPTLQALLLGAITGVLATTKSTYLPHGVIFVGCFALFQTRRRGLSSGIKTLLLAALSCLIVMAPWMIASHATSGTLFYPSLGKGYQYSAYGLYPAPSGAGLSILLHKVVPFCAPLLFLLGLEWYLGDRDEQGEAILALSAAALCATLLVGIGTGGDSVRRYNYPCIIPAMLLLYIVFSRRRNTFPGSRRWPILQTVSILFIAYTAITTWRNKFTNEYDQIPLGLKAALQDTPIVPPSVTAEYAAVQRAIPTDAGVLATVTNSFLFDYRANAISIADYPGAASLPSGWPSRGDGNALASYLLAHNLRYLVCSYADFVPLDHEAVKVLHDPSRTQWIHSEQAIILRSHQQYDELARTRRHLYDDGQIYVLDLAEPGRDEPH